MKHGYQPKITGDHKRPKPPDSEYDAPEMRGGASLIGEDGTVGESKAKCQFSQLFTNDNGRLSTTNTIQMMSAITLCVGFFVAMLFDLTVPSELAFIIAGMATLTATSKGFVAMKRDKDHEQT